MIAIESTRIASTVPAATLTAGQRWRMLLLETRGEVLKQARIPAFVLPTLGLPLIFYGLFGLAVGGGKTLGSTPLEAYLLASHGCFAVVAAALFSVGVGVATERGQGWMLFKRATPLPLAVHFAARVLAGLFFGTLAILLLFAVSAAFSDLRLPTATWVGLALTLTLGMLPFAAIGLALGYVTGPNSAPGIINVIYLPMAMISGLGIPLEFLPATLRGIAPYLPTYHLGQLALAQVGAARPDSTSTALVALATTTILGLAVATWGYRRDTGATWG